MVPGRAVIFDMDGVLVDSYQAHLESWGTAARRRGLREMTEAEFAATFGRVSRDIIQRIWPGRLTDAGMAEMDAEKENEYRRIIRGRFPAVEGAPELVEALHEAGFALAIGSSGPRENVRVVLDCLPGARHIAATVDGSEVARGKPDPQVFLLAAGKLGVRPRDCAVIEDAPAGLEAADKAGMAAVALTGTADRAALAPRAQLVVDSLRELSPAVIARLIDEHDNVSITSR